MKIVRLLWRKALSMAEAVSKQTVEKSLPDLGKAGDLEKAAVGTKRKLDSPDTEGGAKKEKVSDEEASNERWFHGKKKKVAAYIGYNGKGYYGNQINKPYPTIEEEVFKALLKVGAITQDHHDTPKKMSFQRATRTDKEVSACMNLISLKMRIDIEDLVAKINNELPPQIRFFGYVKATRSFDAKFQCTGRTYVYILPTHALAPDKQKVSDHYRVTEEILTKTSEILGKFVGTHNFHNYTSGIKPHEPQAKRYIRSFVCGKPFIKDGMEFVILTVNGQSFVLHHIRKMIGITIAIVRGCCGSEVIELSWRPEKVDIPKAPGLGLLLQDLEYDGYNKKWGCDGDHDPITSKPYEAEILKFRDEVILPYMYKTEREEKVMKSWLETLHLHTFDNSRVDRDVTRQPIKESDTKNDGGNQPIRTCNTDFENSKEPMGIKDEKEEEAIETGRESGNMEQKTMVEQDTSNAKENDIREEKTDTSGIGCSAESGS